MIDPFLRLGCGSGFLRDVILRLRLFVFFPFALSNVLSASVSISSGILVVIFVSAVVIVVVSFAYFRCRIDPVLS